MKQYFVKAECVVDLAGIPDLEAEVAAWIQPYLEEERSSRKRVHSMAYHRMEKRCRAAGVVGVQMKEQACFAAKAAVAKWLAAS